MSRLAQKDEAADAGRWIRSHSRSVEIDAPAAGARTVTSITAKELRVTAPEFLRRLLLHALPRGFVRVRHYGVLANRHRADQLVRCRDLLGASTPRATPETEPSPPALSPAARILRLTGVDILRCPLCRAGPMRWIAQLIPDTS